LAAINYRCDGATFAFGEQIQPRWSNFWWWASKFSLDGATFTFGEQIQPRWSNFHVHGANPTTMEQFRNSAQTSNMHI